MNRFRNILVAIEGDRPAEALLARATRLAKQNHAAVKLIDVVEDLPWYSRMMLPNAEGAQAALVRGRGEVLERVAEPIRKHGLTVFTEVVRGRRDVELVREILRGKNDLLMKEADPNESVLFGSIDMHLLRTCPCPLWLEKPGQGDRPYSRILATVDPAPVPDEADLLHIKDDLNPKDPGLDLKILELATSLAAGDAAELHVLHVWSAPGEELLQGNMMVTQDQVERYADDLRSEAQKALDRLLSKFTDKSDRRTVHLLKGDATEEISEFVKKHQIEMVVMGTVARTGISSVLIGNTAESILQRVNCSVLAVKPAGFVSPVQLPE